MRRQNNRRGAIAAGHPATADAAAEILEEDGNAFDAALAAMMVACVAEPILASPGGGGFLMAFDAARDRTTLIDFFTQTPMSAVRDPDVAEIAADFGKTKQRFLVGYGTSATPGVVPGLFAIHEAVGRLPLSRVLEPSIRLAIEGVTVTGYQAYLSRVAKAVVVYGDDAAGLYTDNGEPFAEGVVHRNPDFGDVVDCLAREGPRFYQEGEFGRAIVSACVEGGGHLRQADLAGYNVEFRAPLVMPWGRAEVALNPGPSAGGPLIATAMRLLEAIGPVSVGDVPTPAVLAAVMEQVNALRRRAQHGAGHGHPDPYSELAIHEQLAQLASHPATARGTTHISVVDRAGNAAALTLSNGTGCGRLVPGCGFMLNNMLGEDDLNPEGAAGDWPRDVRLSSMMAPTLVAWPRGERRVALGSGGSNRIRSAILQVALRVIAEPDALEEAIVAPRVHVERDGKVSFEDQYRDDQRSELLDIWPEAEAWSEPNMFFGGVHAVSHTDAGQFATAADPRRGGAVRYA